MGADELVEVVDTEGRVLRVVSRAEMRRSTLRHRSTYIVVIRSNGALVVHRRSDWKDVYPGFWDIAFGGVAAVGEDWETAAARELAEEAGITGVTLQDMGSGSYDAPDGHVVARRFLARTDLDVTCPDGEVVEAGEVLRSHLDEWLSTHDVCPDSLSLMLPLLTGGGEPDQVTKR